MATTLAPTDVAARLRLAITRTARRLRQEAASGLSPSLTAALATVAREGPLTPSELAAAEQIRRPTATRLIARLHDAGLVARAGDPADRRSSLISITPAGEELLETTRTRKDAYLAERLAELDPWQLDVLRRAATILERLLEEERR